MKDVRVKKLVSRASRQASLDNSFDSIQSDEIKEIEEKKEKFELSKSKPKYEPTIKIAKNEPMLKSLKVINQFQIET